MTPKYFSFTTWEGEPIAFCDERRFTVAEAIPADFIGPASFTVDGAGSWYDVIGTRVGVLLFSERVVSGFRNDGISGIEFYEAPISRVDSAPLRSKPRPTYYWGRALGLIDFDFAGMRQTGRKIPTKVDGASDCDVFHFNYPTGPAGYACVFHVLESFRRHRISNLRVIPLDYYKVNKADFFTPPFRIDVLAKNWPPAAWYPEGFVPLASNLGEVPPS